MVYKEGMETRHEKTALEWMLDPYLLALLVVLALYVLYRGQHLEPFDKAEVYGIYATAAVLLLKGTSSMFKLASPQFVADNLHASTDGKLIRAGNWGISKLGVVDSYGIHEEFGMEGTTIYPLTSLNMVGRNVVAHVRVVEVDFGTLPPEVRVACLQQKCDPPYYLGFFTTEQELVSPDKVYLEEESKKLYERVTMLETELKDTRRIVEDRASYEERIREREKPVSEKLKKIFKPEGEA